MEISPADRDQSPAEKPDIFMDLIRDTFTRVPPLLPRPYDTSTGMLAFEQRWENPEKLKEDADYIATGRTPAHDLIYGVYSDALGQWFSENRNELKAKGVSDQEMLRAVALYSLLAGASSSCYMPGLVDSQELNPALDRQAEGFVRALSLVAPLPAESEDVNQRFKARAEALNARISADPDYLSRQKALNTSLESRTALLSAVREIHHRVLCTGEIRPIDDQFTMTVPEAELQCLRADLAFTLFPEIQPLLADANYSFFTGRTMATAKEMLQLDLQEFYTEGMVHLTAGNAAIGYGVCAQLLARASEGQNEFVIVDLGSGSGATLAGITLGLREADKLLDTPVKVRIISIESCRSFQESLKDEMLPAIKAACGDMEKCRVELVSIQGDIVREASQLPATEDLIVTCNYVFHRLSDSAKGEVVATLGGKSRNCAFLLGDICRNDSKMPNRGYFNFGLNGPLNPGNDPCLMEDLLRTNGFSRFFNEENLGDIAGIPDEVVEACRKAQALRQGFIMMGFK